MNIISVVVIILLLGFLVIIGGVLSIDFYLTMKNANGWIWQERHGTAYKEILKEKDGCVEFTDIWGGYNKVCGVYQIQKI